MQSSKEIYQELLKAHPYLNDLASIKKLTAKQWEDNMKIIPELRQLKSAIEWEERDRKARAKKHFYTR